MGVRPEHVVLSESGPIRGRVFAVEYLGTNQIVTEILKNPKTFPHLIAGISHHDPVIRMRAADSIEKITLQRPDLLRPFKEKLLALATGSAAPSLQQEVRWHLALLLPRLELTLTERALATDILFEYLDDDGSPHTIDSTDVNAYLDSITNPDDHFTAKDFRTWAGSVLASELLATFEHGGGAQ